MDPLRKKTDKIRKILRAAYPDVKTALTHRNAFELLVATILSAQTTDRQVNSVTGALFEKFPTAAALAAAPLREIETLIRPTGFFHNKARNIKAWEPPSGSRAWSSTPMSSASAGASG